MVGETALIEIEVRGMKSLCRVGLPFEPQPDNSSKVSKPDHNKLNMRILHETLEMNLGMDMGNLCSANNPGNSDSKH
jgi:hypothetical protein